MSLYSYSYSAPYVIVILILFGLAYAEGRADDGIRKGKLVNTASAILILFFGLRGFIQSDFQNYYPWFEELPTLWDRNFFQAFAKIRKHIAPSTNCLPENAGNEKCVTFVTHNR